MSGKTRKSTAQKSRRRTTRDLPPGDALREKAVKGGTTSPHTGVILVAMGDGSVRMGDGSVRFVTDSVTTTVWR
jgi:hypothetical protein